MSYFAQDDITAKITFRKSENRKIRKNKTTSSNKVNTGLAKQRGFDIFVIHILFSLPINNNLC